MIIPYFLPTLERVRILLYDGAETARVWFATHENELLFAAFALLFAAFVWIASGMWHTHYAGKRKMAAEKIQKQRLLELKAYDKWLDLTLEMYAKNEITAEQQSIMDYKVARAFNHPDLIPKRSQDAITRRLKSFLLWKRSDDPAAVTLREAHAKPVNIPGPKPGEKTEPLTPAPVASTVKERLAKAFTRKKAA